MLPAEVKEELKLEFDSDFESLFDVEVGGDNTSRLSAGMGGASVDIRDVIDSAVDFRELSS